MESKKSKRNNPQTFFTTPSVMKKSYRGSLKERLLQQETSQELSVMQEKLEEKEREV
jgi:hypothetical protein